MNYADFDLLNVNVADGVAATAIAAPPMNVMTLKLFRQLAKFSAQVAEDDDVGVVVLRSADPEFFIAHFDVEAILEFPIDAEPARDPELRGFHKMCETFAAMPKVTIAEIAGRIGGGGNELAMSCDMRFGAIGQTVINQMEVPLGILPGGTGTQRLPQLVGTGRAMEIILGGIDVDAETAETWGLINRALPPDELSSYVDRLASRIASYPRPAVQLAKQSIRNAGVLTHDEGRIEEAFLFQQTIREPEARERMRRFLTLGGQTRDGERDLTEILDRL
jgi:enoyl-CoA hydratase/carnithine racemase